MDADGRFSETIVPRITNEEVSQLIEGNEALNNMFKKFKPYQGDLFGHRDYTDGILYLSRINAEARRPANKVDEGTDGAKDTDDPKKSQETKSERTTTMTSHNREKRGALLCL